MRTKRHKVMVKNPHLKSHAAAILLCKKYRKLELFTYLRFRKEFLDTFSDDKLKCFYCGKTNLMRELPEGEVKQPHNLATVDHVIPISKGGQKYDHNNCVVACYRCNQRKKDSIL
jgi:5-methylcytosine-specific restriction endonuclease McrA